VEGDAVSVEHYAFGRVTIAGRTYTSDVIAWPEGVDDSWWRAEGHRVCAEDLEPILNKRPDVVIIGTGAFGVMEIPPEVLAHLRERCPEVHIEKTEKACALYNDLAGGPRRVVAALHLTC
jgi:hypothetical protein